MPRSFRRALPLARRLCAWACACILLQPAFANEPAQRAQMLEAAVPAYPEHARRRDQEGTVRVRARVLADGQVSDVQVERSSGVPALDQAAIGAVQASKFRAAQDASGAPVDSWVVVPYKFVLQD